VKKEATVDALVCAFLFFYGVIGEPVDLKGAEALAKEDPYQFQWWALSLVGARPSAWRGALE